MTRSWRNPHKYSSTSQDFWHTSATTSTIKPTGSLLLASLGISRISLSRRSNNKKNGCQKLRCRWQQGSRPRQQKVCTFFFVLFFILCLINPDTGFCSPAQAFEVTVFSSTSPPASSSSTSSRCLQIVPYCTAMTAPEESSSTDRDFSAITTDEIRSFRYLDMHRYMDHAFKDLVTPEELYKLKSINLNGIDYLEGTWTDFWINRLGLGYAAARSATRDVCRLLKIEDDIPNRLGLSCSISTQMILLLTYFRAIKLVNHHPQIPGHPTIHQDSCRAFSTIYTSVAGRGCQSPLGGVS